MSKPDKKDLIRIIDATGYSMKGLKGAWQNEAAFRQEISLFVIGLPVAFWLSTSAYDFLWLSLPLFLILMAELSNSAIEAAIDRIGPEYHELSSLAKDASKRSLPVGSPEYESISEKTDEFLKTLSTN